MIKSSNTGISFYGDTLEVFDLISNYLGVSRSLVNEMALINGRDKLINSLRKHAESEKNNFYLVTRYKNLGVRFNDYDKSYLYKNHKTFLSQLNKIS